MEPASYCISLPMAQRPELHAAMHSVGAVAHFRWSGILPEIDHTGHDWNWQIMERVCVRICPERRWDAYHLGELWVAARTLTERAGGQRHRLIASSDRPGYAMARLPGPGWGNFKRGESMHAPDALAELVIALYKEASDVR